MSWISKIINHSWWVHLCLIYTQLKVLSHYNGQEFCMDTCILTLLSLGLLNWHRVKYQISIQNNEAQTMYIILRNFMLHSSCLYWLCNLIHGLCGCSICFVLCKIMYIFTRWTQLSQEMHVCACKLGCLWFRLAVTSFSASHYLNQCCLLSFGSRGRNFSQIICTH